jgi:hypothetical protein
MHIKIVSNFSINFPIYYFILKITWEIPLKECNCYGISLNVNSVHNIKTWVHERNWWKGWILVKTPVFELWMTEINWLTLKDCLQLIWVIQVNQYFKYLSVIQNEFWFKMIFYSKKHLSIKMSSIHR